MEQNIQDLKDLFGEVQKCQEEVIAEAGGDDVFQFIFFGVQCEVRSWEKLFIFKCKE